MMTDDEGYRLECKVIDLAARVRVLESAILHLKTFGNLPKDWTPPATAQPSENKP